MEASESNQYQSTTTKRSNVNLFSGIRFLGSISWVKPEQSLGLLSQRPKK